MVVVVDSVGCTTVFVVVDSVEGTIVFVVVDSVCCKTVFVVVALQRPLKSSISLLLEY